MSEMVERVAEAIVAEMVRQCGTPPPKDPTLSEGAIKVARAAIEAMREPTKAMLVGARDWSIQKNGQGVGNDQATECWRAMIDVALDPADCVRETGKA